MITNQETIERAIVRDLQALRHVIPGHRITRNKGGSNATIHINFHRRTDMICDRVSSAIRALFRGAEREYNSRKVKTRSWGTIHFATLDLPNRAADISLVPNNASAFAFRKATKSYIERRE